MHRSCTLSCNLLWWLALAFLIVCKQSCPKNAAVLVTTRHNAGIYVNTNIDANIIEITHVNKKMNKYLCGLTVFLSSNEFLNSTGWKTKLLLGRWNGGQEIRLSCFTYKKPIDRNRDPSQKLGGGNPHTKPWYVFHSCVNCLCAPSRGTTVSGAVSTNNSQHATDDVTPRHTSFNLSFSPVIENYLSFRQHQQKQTFKCSQ